MSRPPERDPDFELALYESVLSDDPANVEALIALGEAYTHRGAFAEGLAVDRRLASLRPADPVVRYNLACSLSLLGCAEESLAELAAAVDRGYRDAAHMDGDRDLDKVRSDPRFAALRARMLGAGPPHPASG